MRVPFFVLTSVIVACSSGSSGGGVSQDGGIGGAGTGGTGGGATGGTSGNGGTGKNLQPNSPVLLSSCDPTGETRCSSDGKVVSCDIVDGAYKWVFVEACNPPLGCNDATPEGQPKSATCGCPSTVTICETDEFGSANVSLCTADGVFSACCECIGATCNAGTCACPSGAQIVTEPTPGECRYACSSDPSLYNTCYLYSLQSCPATLEQCLQTELGF